MKKIISVLALFGIVNLASCSGGENAVEVSVTTAVRPVIPAAIASCLARKVAKETATYPTPDVTAAYFSIPQLTFTPQHKNRDVYISFIKITYTVPGAASAATCEVGGDGLAALKTEWYDSANKEALISAGATGDDLKTDCPIYCGGIDKDTPPFSATASVVIYGYEQNPSDANDAVGFTTTTYVNFGKQ